MSKQILQGYDTNNIEEINNSKIVDKGKNCNLKNLSLTSHTSSENLEIITTIHDFIQESKPTKNNEKCASKDIVTICSFLFGIILIILSLYTYHHTIFDYLMEERLKMTPGLPPYELWVRPKPIIYAKAYIFTISNKDRFLEGIDKKLKLEEIGPIVYREHLIHKDIEFHNNSTMSYTIQRYLEFLPHKNEENILNRTIIVPNIVLLGMAAYLQNYMYFTKVSFNIMSKNDPIFLNTTVYNYLWNLTTPALDLAKNVVPFLIPQDNGGALHNVYRNFTDRVNVRIGNKYGGREFFMINSYNGRQTVPGFSPEHGDCFADIQNSTEGAIYGNYITKKSVLNFWRKTVCRIVPLYFEEEVQFRSLRAYKFIAKTNLYNRFKNEMQDCYKGFGNYHLPDGLSDASKCYDGIPVAVSLPHFYGSDGYWNKFLEGFAPSKEKHGSYTILEPVTGVPLGQVARSQSNLILPNLTSFNPKIQKFSKMVIPIFWLEYHQEKITTTIYLLLVFMVNILPWFQYLISTGILITGIFYTLIGYMRFKSIRSFKELYLIIMRNIGKKSYNINNNEVHVDNENQTNKKMFKQ